MASRIAVSFENETIKIVYGSVSRNKLSVRKALRIGDEELDEFLRKEKARNFTVINDFKAFYQDILLLPPVKDNLLKGIIESEIRKRAAELKDFSYVYNIMGERLHEGRRIKEVFVFAAPAGPDGELHKIIERFARRGKTISCLYPSAFALSPLVHSEMPAGKPDEAALCVAEAGLSKTLFLIKNNRLCFVRTAQAFESGIHDFDVQNINMTINYCRQTLRMNPSKIIFMGDVSSVYDAKMDVLAPSVSLKYPANIAMPADIITTYDADAAASFLAPISALLYAKELGGANILPQSYKDFNLQKRLFSYLALIFMLLSAGGLVYLTDKASDIKALNKKIASARSEIKRMEGARTDYEDKDKGLQKMLPLIQYMNAASASPDIRKALIAVSELKDGYTRISGGVLNLTSVSAKPEGDSVRLDLKGSVRAGNFAGAHKTYQGIISAVKNIKGMEIASEKIEFKSRDFQMSLKYKSPEIMEQQKK
jgi:hypothetical protein